MKLFPTAAEKASFLVLILLGMAWLIPQCWVTGSRAASNEWACKCWITSYVGILFFSCVVAGTKRQIILGLLLMTTAAPMFLWNYDSPSVNWGSGRAPYVGVELSGLRSVFDAGTRLLAALCVVLAASIGLSYWLDRHVGPVIGSRGPEQPSDDSDEGNAKTKRSLLQVLIPLLVVLFLVQAVGNIAGTQFGSGGASARYLLPIGVTFLVVFGVGLICRLKTLAALGTGVSLALATAGGLYAIAINEGSNVPVIVLLVFFGACSVVIAVVFAMLGRGKQRSQLLFSPLSALLVFLVGAFTWLGAKYDLYTLALGVDQLDFPQAAFVKSVNSKRGVNIKYDSNGRWGNVQFEFLPTGRNDNLLNELMLEGFSKTRNRITFIGMQSTVDLSRFSELKPRIISVSDSNLATSQLRELLYPGVRIWFFDCRFVADEVNVDSFVGSAQVQVNNGAKAFLNATKKLDLQSDLSLYFGEPMNSQDLESVIGLIQRSTMEDTIVYVSDANNLELIDLQTLRDRPELRRVMLEHCTLALDQNGRAKKPRPFELVLESEIGVSCNIVDRKLAWKLALASNGDFFHSLSLGQFSDLRQISIEDSFFVYARNETGAAEKLWIPWCNKAVLRECTDMESLTALSFDVDWLKGNGTKSEFYGLALAKVNETLLNQLTGLRELYFSPSNDVNLSSLTDLRNLETLQIASSTKGFRHDLFPNLKEVRLLVNGPIKNGLMNELKKTESLESLVVVDLFEVDFSAKQFLIQSDRLFGGKVKVVAIERRDVSDFAPADFQQYLLDLRSRCIKEYLGR